MREEGNWESLVATVLAAVLPEIQRSFLSEIHEEYLSPTFGVGQAEKVSGYRDATVHGVAVTNRSGTK